MSSPEILSDKWFRVRAVAVWVEEGGLCPERRPDGTTHLRQAVAEALEWAALAAYKHGTLHENGARMLRAQAEKVRSA